VEDLNSSLTELAGELWRCKLGWKCSNGGRKLDNTFCKYNPLNLLPCVCFIRLGGRKRRAESEKGAMEEKSLRNTEIDRCMMHIAPVACRGLVMPGATAWLDAPLPNASIEQWRLVVIVTGYMLFVMLYSDLQPTFWRNYWHNMAMHI